MQNASEPVAIRTASLDDTALLARLGAHTFAQAFADANSPEDMAAYLASAFSPEAQAAELRDPDTLFLIASVGGEPAGYAKLCVTEAPECVAGGRPVELVRFYVEATWHGAGVSHALMRETIARAADRGRDIVWLGVWEQNHRAIGFYKKWDFAVVGTKPFQLGADVQTDFVMSRPVEATAAGA
jgi:ribosomal protein S18 acetylase RimI-like enzyme